MVLAEPKGFDMRLEARSLARCAEATQPKDSGTRLFSQCFTCFSQGMLFLSQGREICGK